MMKMRGFLVGLAGGAVGAALVVLVLVLVFDFGEAKQTVVEATPETPAVYSAPAASRAARPTRSTRASRAASSWSCPTSPAPAPTSSASRRAARRSAPASSSTTTATSSPTPTWSTRTARRRSSVTVVFNKGGSETQRVKGELVGVDVGSDVAVIKVDPSGVDLKPLPLGDSAKVVVGEPVVAIGNPLGYDFSITSGIVSATGRSLQAPNGQTIPNGIQTDAAINQGNSGGPLIDASGKVIGINEQIASQGGGNDGLGFAVPINTAIRSLEQLKTTGKVQYAWMGVGLKTLTSDVAGTFNMKTQGGALVETGLAGQPGGQGRHQGRRPDGHRPGPAVHHRRRRHHQGRRHRRSRRFDDLIAFLGTKKPGDKVTLTVERDGKTQDVTVTLAERPANL